MIKRLREKLQTGRAVTVLGILFLCTQTVVAVILNPLGVGTFLKLQLSLSKDFYGTTFDAWKAEGVFARYPLHLYPDLLHPLFYSLFFFSALACLLKGEPDSPKVRFLLALPLVSGLSDYVENAIQFSILSGHLTSPLVFASGLASWVKWGLALISILLMGGLALRRAVTAAR